MLHMQASDLPGATELAAAQQPLQVCLTHGMQVVSEHGQHAHQQKHIAHDIPALACLAPVSFLGNVEGLALNSMPVSEGVSVPLCQIPCFFGRPCRLQHAHRPFPQPGGLSYSSARPVRRVHSLIGCEIRPQLLQRMLGQVAQDTQVLGPGLKMHTYPD